MGQVKALIADIHESVLTYGIADTAKKYRMSKKDVVKTFKQWEGHE
jgi:flagellar biosynthesis protein FlhB|tara:strand:+ start:2689 stop:2826 length:138 start_codon:yes stop_codon:yes gene_type:complete